MKKLQSAKARAASIKNITNWERFQESVARVSDNKKMISIGFAIGTVVISLSYFVALSVNKFLCTI